MPWGGVNSSLTRHHVASKMRKRFLNLGSTQARCQIDTQGTKQLLTAFCGDEIRSTFSVLIWRRLLFGRDYARTSEAYL
jgi:hypothetical protein